MEPVDQRTVAAWAAHLGVPPGDVDAESLRAELCAGALPSCFADAAAQHPAATLSIDGERRRHGEVLAQAGRAASVLRQQGVGRGTRVLIAASTSWSLVTAYLATLHAGGTAILANPDTGDEQLRTLARRARAGLTLTQHPGFTGPAPGLPLEALAARAETHPELPATPLSADDVAVLAFTSGTTGAPKGVPLTHGMLLASIRAVMRAWRWSPEDVLVHSLPLFHQHGLGGLHATLLAGSSAALLSGFDPRALAHAVEHEEATVLFGVPSIHQRLLGLDPSDLRRLRRLRLVTSGSAPLPPALGERFAQHTGIHPLERYGLTESGLDISNLYAADPAPGAVGYPLPGVEAALLDGTGRPVADDAEGEIALRGPQVFDGYLEDEAATAAAFWPGGWFRTGDLGRRDPAGRLVVSGRLKELIITGGMNVAPREVEQVLEQHPAVAEAAVAGLPSERWGEEVTAWVVPVSTPPTGTDLVAFCREHLTAYKCPKRVYVVGELPRNSMGKVLRSELVSQVESGG